MVALVENINPDILRQCREQIGLAYSDVEKKINKIVSIEEGTQKPTFNQLNTLAELYNVPRWVFISDFLPEQYQFNKAVPTFRQFAYDRAELFSDYKVRSLTARIERLRSLILELRDDMREPVAQFSPPEIQKNDKPEVIATQVRAWLGTEENLDFNQWKEKLEEKNVFVFLTNKYKGWSHIDKAIFRGLAIYHSSLPIIVINDSDGKKAQSFTLFHELGHLLRGESAIDDWEDHHQRVERWCDELAGNVLMPMKPFSAVAQDVNDLETIKQIAKLFKTSTYACLVRLRQLKLIDQTTYVEFDLLLKEEYARLQKKLKERPGGPSRDRPQEALNQYGHIYSRALFQAYNNQEIDLHKLSQAFDLKRTTHALEVGDKL
jgi:Zn-dependent peptidase ImmA (M78 family)